jgi:hypothetical protein
VSPCLHGQTWSKFDEGWNEMDIEDQDEREYPHWNRVYIAVIIYTIALIIGLWVFSKAFQ